MSSETQYLTIVQAAERINVSQRFIAHLIRSEILPVHRFGRSVRIKLATLEALAESASTTPVKGRGQDPGPVRREPSRSEDPGPVRHTTRREPPPISLAESAPTKPVKGRGHHD